MSLSRAPVPIAFLCKALLCLVLFLPLYAWVLPGYVGLISAFCVAITSRGASGFTLTAADGCWKVLVQPGSSSFLFGSQAFTERLFFDITILPSLILATPLSTRQCLSRVLTGEILLFFLNAGSLLFSAQGIALFCVPHISTRACRLLAGMPGLLGMVLTCALWAALTWPSWSNRGAPH